MRYRDDIDIDNTWVVSDTHFGHENIVGFCHRPEDHEQVMIAEWRRVVPDTATVLHLGDLCYRGNAFFKNIVAPELTGGRKLLIKGNHDKKGMNFYRQCGFQVIRPFKLPLGVLRLEDSTDLVAYNGGGHGLDPEIAKGIEYQVSFSHYPWNPSEDGEMRPNDLRLHGHIHNNGYTRDGFVPFLRNHINLSVEQTRYTPVNLGVLLRAYLLGDYQETTQEQLDEARERKEANLRDR